MTISGMGKKHVVLGLAIFLLLSSFHEVSCQADANDDPDIPDQNENESDSAGGSSVEANIAMSGEETSSSEFKADASMTIQGGSSFDESGAASDEEGSPFSNAADEVRRLTADLFTGKNLNVQSKGDDARRKQLEEIERDIQAAAAQKLVEQKFTKTTSETKSEASMESRSNQFESKKSNSGSRVIGSLGIGQTGMWRCVNQDTNGVKEDDDSPINIPKYNLDDIIKEESTYEGSSSKTSSLIASLTAIVAKHKQGRGSSSSVSLGKRTSTEKIEMIEKIKVELKQYRNVKVSQLVTRSDFERILSLAAHYEELTSASVSYISRLSKYKSVIKEETKANKRVQLAQQRATLLDEMANEKQKKVDAELEMVRVYAKKGDALYVKIFALKKAMLKLEAEKKEVEISFQKIVANLSIVIEEAAKAYEEHHMAVRQWREEKTSLEFSYEARESAESVWVSFLGTL
ncbi:hypothetical protein AALP_AA3G180800 [Arabis alpina]|uniref:DNA mismatch repair protein MutS connector domain-containing protein n=1 Tax=Arabis alpina TaxID=50452 RepID=A0A087H9Z6_ARAAL|nr:hypothetical protein AALP_AA3G180800 [Arabis alpina]